MLIDSLVNAPTLAFPDFKKEFKIETDACDYGIGAMISQKNDGIDQQIAYFSRSLNKAERKYSTTEKEALAIVEAIKQFRPFVNGSQLTVVTDHKPLKWLESMQNPRNRGARWIMELQQYNYKVEYKPGKTHINADAISRRPCTEDKCNSIYIDDLPSYEIIED